MATSKQSCIRVGEKLNRQLQSVAAAAAAGCAQGKNLLPATSVLPLVCGWLHHHMRIVRWAMRICDPLRRLTSYVWVDVVPSVAASHIVPVIKRTALCCAACSILTSLASSSCPAQLPTLNIVCGRGEGRHTPPLKAVPRSCHTWFQQEDSIASLFL